MGLFTVGPMWCIKRLRFYWNPKLAEIIKFTSNVGSMGQIIKMCLKDYTPFLHTQKTNAWTNHVDEQKNIFSKQSYILSDQVHTGLLINCLIISSINWIANIPQLEGVDIQYIVQI